MKLKISQINPILKLILATHLIFVFFTSHVFALSRNENLSSNIWTQEEFAEKQELLNAFWQERIIQYNDKSVAAFKSAIINSHFPKDSAWESSIQTLFQDAILHKINFNLFFNSLKDQPLVMFKEMNDVEKLIPNKQYKEINPHITKADLQTIQQYIKNKHMSVSITLGAPAQGLITPHFSENQYAYPFAIHSIGKVFTGILALIMIEDGILSETDLQHPVQLDKSTEAQLPPLVRNQLKKVTLYQLMTHHAGLGDYLGKYCQAIASGHVPMMHRAEDFIPFVENKTYPIGEYRYSNAGILIVGLALKHAYAEKFKKSEEYNTILQHYIIDQVGMPSFSPWKPEIAKYNLSDPIAPFIAGSPAGGYWVTTNELAKFGQWIYSKSSVDPVFKHLIQQYGQEFYHPESDTVAHGGGIDSSSAYLSVSLKTGAVLAIESNQPPGIADDLKTMVQTHIFANKVN